MLRRRLNKKTGRTEYCLVSRDGAHVLEWYGTRKPMDVTVRRSEERVNYWKSKERMGA